MRRSLFCFLLMLSLSPSGAWAWEPLLPECTPVTSFESCKVPGFADRPYAVYRPRNHRREDSTPVVMVLHGGSGDLDGGVRMSCRGADLNDANCWHQVAERYGIAVAYPSGTRITPGSSQRV